MSGSIARSAIGTEAKIDMGEIRWHIAQRESQMGLFNDAWKMVADFPTRGRLPMEYVLTVSEVRAGQLKNITTRVDAMQSPNEKVLVELAAARALLGKTYQGDFHEWRPREDNCHY